MKMQATTLNLPPPSLPYGLTKLPLSLPLPWFPKLRQPTTFRALQLKLKPTAAATNDTPTTVDYSSGTSVFPAEACETIGGEACDAEMYPEVKPPTPQPKNTATNTKESVDREYLQYDEPKTVFPGEACDDLGGEFCEPDYQTGVY
ncbi:light-regulated protein, chloroplastic-like [Humulus lupulus]|uniref:light-regulated protein, chloroplastic-like n=1 Tax=Humulus lupulus TaxID=3486 RepID=UPI002B4036A4|nr:light-regulated protein, chloroplastic-like [Humulus lupulus]